MHCNVVKQGNKWVVTNRATDEEIGTYDNREKAEVAARDCEETGQKPGKQIEKKTSMEFPNAQMLPSKRTEAKYHIELCHSYSICSLYRKRQEARAHPSVCRVTTQMRPMRQLGQ